MTASLAHFLESAAHLIVPWLITYALHSTLLLGTAVIIGAWVFRDSRSRELVLKLALVGAVLSTTLHLVNPAGPLAFHLSAPPRAGGREIVVPVRPAQETAGTWAADVGAYPSATPPSLTTRKVVQTSPETRMGWPGVVLFAWVLGVLALGLRYALRWQRFLQNIRDRREVRSAPLTSRLRKLERHAGIRQPVTLTASQRIDDLVAMGTAEICVPVKLLPDLAEHEQESALAHEIAHLRRRDPLWVVAAQVLGVLFFFQPLQRLVGRRLQEEAEYLCDEWAVQHAGDPEALAQSLLKTALLREREAPVLAVAPGMANKEATIMRRTRRILNWNGTTVTTGGSRITFACALGVLLLVGSVAPRALIREADPRPPLVTETLVDLTEPDALAELAGWLLTELHQGPVEEGTEVTITIETSDDDQNQERYSVHHGRDGEVTASYHINDEEQPFTEETIMELLDLVEVDRGPHVEHLQALPAAPAPHAVPAVPAVPNVTALPLPDVAPRVHLDHGRIRLARALRGRLSMKIGQRLERHLEAIARHREGAGVHIELESVYRDIRE